MRIGRRLARKAAVDDQHALLGHGFCQRFDKRPSHRIEHNLRPATGSETLYLGDDIGFLAGDHVPCAQRQQCLGLVAATGERDGLGADPVGDLDRREAHAAGRGWNEDGVAHASVARLDDPERGEILHPDRGRFDRRKLFWRRQATAGGHDGALGVNAIFAKAEGRQHADPVACPMIGNALADRFDDSRGFIAQQAGKPGRDGISPRPVHGLGPVQPDRLDPQAQFARSGVTDHQGFELHHVRAARAVDAHDSAGGCGIHAGNFRRDLNSR